MRLGLNSYLALHYRRTIDHQEKKWNKTITSEGLKVDLDMGYLTFKKHVKSACNPVD